MNGSGIELGAMDSEAKSLKRGKEPRILDFGMAY